MDMVERRWPSDPRRSHIFAALFLFGAARVTGSPVWETRRVA